MIQVPGMISILHQVKELKEKVDWGIKAETAPAYERPSASRRRAARSSAAAAP